MDTLDNTLYMLSKSFDITVRLVISGNAEITIPDDSKTLPEIIGETSWSGKISSGKKQLNIAQYLINKYSEQYICIQISADKEIWLGPVLSKKATDGFITETIRKYTLPINKKNLIAEHYRKLKNISDDRLYYMGKLTELLINIDNDDYDQNQLSKYNHIELDNTPTFLPRLFSFENSQTFEHPPYFLELEMVRLVTSGDVEGALKTMNKINTFSKAVLAKDPVRSYKNSLICDCTFLARAAISGGVPPDDAFMTSDKLICKIEETSSITQLEELEKRHLVEFAELVHSYNETYLSKPVRDVVDYVQKNLGSPLSLDILARVALVHKNYLANLFKKEMGQSPMKYVTIQRIEESKIFLRYTDEEILDIAMFYQFSSQSHFTQNFSKIVGMTPLQYRLYEGQA